MVGASTSFSQRTKGNIFSPLFDLAVLGVVPLICFLVFEAIDAISPFLTASKFGIEALVWLSYVINQPHYTATYYRVYRSWNETKRYAGAAIWAPLLLLLLVVGCFVAPTVVAPWFCKAYFLTVSYHYAGQNYGIGLILTHKAGIKVDRLFKVCLGLPIYTSALVYLIGDEVVFKRQYFLDVPLHMLGFPQWSYLLALSVFIISVFCYIIGSVVLAKDNRKIPLIVHILVLSQVIWFTVGTRLELFVLFVPVFHCVQYLMITTYFRFQELNRSGKIQIPDPFQFFKSPYFWRYYAILIIVGLILFNLIPWAISSSKVATQSFVYAVIYSFVNLHHFLLDGEIWKLRKPEVGNTLFESKA